MTDSFFRYKDLAEIPSSFLVYPSRIRKMDRVRRSCRTSIISFAISIFCFIRAQDIWNFSSLFPIKILLSLSLCSPDAATETFMVIPIRFFLFPSIIRSSHHSDHLPIWKAASIIATAFLTFCLPWYFSSFLLSNLPSYDMFTVTIWGISGRNGRSFQWTSMRTRTRHDHIVRTSSRSTQEPLFQRKALSKYLGLLNTFLVRTESWGGYSWKPFYF